MSRMLISGGRVFSSSEPDGIVTDLAIDNGIVVASGALVDSFEADNRIDASDCWVIPGGIDIACQLLSPNARLSIEDEFAHAAAGGLTDVCQSPSIDQRIDSAAVVETLRERAARTQLGRYHLVASALTRNVGDDHAASLALSEMRSLADAGAAAVWLDASAFTDRLLIRRAFEYAKDLGLTLFVQPTDPTLAGHGCVHEGSIATRLGLPGIPVAAETAALGMLTSLMEQTGAKVHICRLSSASGVNLVREAKSRGLPVTADVSIHNLELTDEAVDGFDPRAHLSPPLRSAADRDALKSAIMDRTIDMLCSGHVALGSDAKRSPFPSTTAGAAASDLLLPLLVDAVLAGDCNMTVLRQALSESPAQLLGMEPVTLEADSRADICIVDPAATTEIGASGRDQWTPLAGRTLRASVRATIRDGLVIYQAQ